MDVAARGRALPAVSGTGAPMLVELSVRDFAIVESVRLELDAGLNVLTGETGAGKSILVDAAGLVLGARADTSTVRAGADRATVQAVFAPPDDDAWRGLLDELGVPHEPEVVIDREVHAAGRSVARVNGHVVTAGALDRLGRRLIDVHGQAETDSLRREAEHVEILDRYCALSQTRARLGARVDALRAATRELEGLHADEAAMARRRDALEWQIREIDAAGVKEGEEAGLVAERDRLANAERLASLAAEAYAALRGGEEGRRGGLDLVETAVEAVRELAAIDATMADVLEPAADALLALGEVAARMRDYRDDIEFNPARLDELEGRLAQIADLKRKYGGSEAEVLAWRERAADELLQLEASGERGDELAEQVSALTEEALADAVQLSKDRHAGARRLAEAVSAQMSELGMEGSRFDVEVAPNSDPEGMPVDGERVALSRRGIDRVRFLASTNPGEPLRPLTKVASGGETARVMLALKSSLGAADAVPTLIFDEIDAGIGGRVGAVVGRKLWTLASAHQVLCVTHLPQVAAYADAHHHVRKELARGRATTQVARLTDEERPEELSAMLGAPSDAGLASARDLLSAAHDWKSGAAAA